MTTSGSGSAGLPLLVQVLVACTFRSQTKAELLTI